MLTLSAFDLEHPVNTGLIVKCLDAAGYRRFWATEHRSARQSASPLVVASVAAALTERLRVGTAGIKLRYYNPLKVAEDFCLLERMFPNRVDVGVIGGGESERVIDTALLGGVSEELHPTYASKVALLAELLRSDVDSDEARVKSARGEHGPTMWVCSLGRESAKLAGAHGCSFAYSAYFPQMTGKAPDPTVVDEYRDSYRGSGEPMAVVTCFGACAENEAEAMATWRTFSGWRSSDVVTANAGLGPNRRTSPNFVGNPDDCYDQLREIAEKFRISELVIHCFGTSLSAKLQAYRLLAERFDLCAPPAARSVSSDGTLSEHSNGRV